MAKEAVQQPKQEQTFTSSNNNENTNYMLKPENIKFLSQFGGKSLIAE